MYYAGIVCLQMELCSYATASNVSHTISIDPTYIYGRHTDKHIYTRTHAQTYTHIHTYTRSRLLASLAAPASHTAGRLMDSRAMCLPHEPISLGTAQI